MKRLLCAVVLVTAISAVPASAHYKGCRTNACDQRVSYPHQRPTAHTTSSTTSTTTWAWTYTAFDDCVVLHESTRNRYASNGTDESYYQWLPATWQIAQRDVGVSFSQSPFDATLAQQTYVFNLWEPVNNHRTNWPMTVPECGG